MGFGALRALWPLAVNAPQLGQAFLAFLKRLSYPCRNLTWSKSNSDCHFAWETRSLYSELPESLLAWSQFSNFG